MPENYPEFEHLSLAEKDAVIAELTVMVRELYESKGLPIPAVCGPCRAARELEAALIVAEVDTWLAGGAA